MSWELQAQLEEHKEKEAQFKQSINANTKKLREDFKRERELEWTMMAQIASTKISSQREAEEKRAIELQEIQRTAKKERERLNHGKQK